MTASDRPMSPRRAKPGAKLGLLLGGLALVALVMGIVTTGRAQPPPDKRDHSARTASRQGSAGVLAGPDRKAIDAALRQLQRRLATLRHDPTMKPDHWADAQVFVKAVVWAL